MRVNAAKSMLLVLVCAVACPGCAFMAGAAAGGVAGYMLKERGYEVRAPVTRTQTAAGQAAGGYTHSARQ